jgi:hypothetical protein
LIYSYINTRGNWENSKLCENTPPFGRRVSTQFLVFPISMSVDITVYQHGKCFIFVKHRIFFWSIFIESWAGRFRNLNKFFRGMLPITCSELKCLIFKCFLKELKFLISFKFSFKLFHSFTAQYFVIEPKNSKKQIRPGKHGNIIFICPWHAKIS